MAVEAPPAPPAAPAVPAVPAAAAPSAPPPNMIDPLPVPSNPPRPGSARERMRKETSTKWGEEPASPATPAKPSETPPAAKPGEPPARPGEQPEGAEPPADVTPEQKKKNPWKLWRESEAKAKQLERQMEEGKSASLAETEKAQYLEKIEKAEAKLKTYEDEIRFKSYEKSEEFATKYEQPYEKAWNKHIKDLEGVTVAGEDGVARPMQAQDILDLVNLGLPDARRLAVDKWGDFANEAMLARKEIRDLFEAKTNALKEAREKGAEREKTFQDNAKKWRDGVQKHIKDTWEAANQEAQKHPTSGEFFKPVEGDDKWNELLTKGYNRVDEAFAKNPMDPNLSPEDRVKAVKAQAAIRNRSAAFGPMKYLILRMRAEIEALKKANEQFKGSTPPAGGGTAAGGAGAPGGGSARDRMHAAGDRYSK